MVSSYGKHTWFHQVVGVCSFLLIALSFALLHSKQSACTTPLLPREQLYNWVDRPTPLTELSAATLTKRNQTDLAEEMIDYVTHYYQRDGTFHWIILGWCGVLLLLTCINIVPSHEDAKVATLLITISVMGVMALFALYMAYVAFEKPCKETTPSKSGASTVAAQLYSQTRETISALSTKLSLPLNISTSHVKMGPGVPHTFTPSTYPSASFSPTAHSHSSAPPTVVRNLSSIWPPPFKLEFRGSRDKRPVNVYEDEDETMILVTSIDGVVGMIMLCSSFLFFFDSRQHMIEWRN